MESLAPAGDEEIRNAEQQLDLKFADDYKEYLSCFGAVWSELVTVTGISDDKGCDVVKLTKKLRPFYREISPDFYVIEDVGVDGLVIWQDETGAVYQSVPCQEHLQIFNSLSDYLRYVMEDQTE